MKLYEAGAVLLIVGQATIGPIERQRGPIPDALDSAWIECFDKAVPPGTILGPDPTVMYRIPASSDHPRGRGHADGDRADDHCREKLDLPKWEPIEQACERAMREIGAVRVLEYGPSKDFPKGVSTIEENSAPPDTYDGPLEAQWWSLPPNGAFDGTGSWNDGRGSIKIETYNQKYRVRCIPAPSGLH